MKIAVLGAGAWGTAVAISLAPRHTVMLWGRNADAMREADARRENVAYLPGCPLPPSLMVTSDLAQALDHVDADGLLIIASAVAGLRPLMGQIGSRHIPNVVWLCKGLEEGSRLLPHQVVREVLGESVPAAVLSGPSFAEEVARGLPCALVAASENAALRDRIVAAAHSQTMRIYSTDDVVGVEIGGAVKNILAVATGIIDGLGFGLNARAALITRGLVEMTRFGVAMGANAETFMGLTGMGDLILTCTGDLSRNRQVGLGLAQGKALDAIIAELGHVVEGVRCASAVRDAARALNVEMPITDAVASVLFDGKPVRDTVAHLLSRTPREESLI